jgi:formylglycine-generating enzyme required for sulfatase activity
MDRYEASLWDDPDKPGKSYDGDYPITFPANGQVVNQEGLLFARSVPGVAPSAMLTWFQANLGCLASGKRLPTGQEWHSAATGTGDVTGVPGPACNTGTGMKRATNGPPGCVSLWGAEDMIGNVGEMLADWQIGPNNGGLGWDQKNVAWGPEYSAAVTYGISSYALAEMGTSLKFGLPAVEVRGGTFGAANVASLYQISTSFSPETAHAEVGFRCMIPR